MSERRDGDWRELGELALVSCGTGSGFGEWGRGRPKRQNLGDGLVSWEQGVRVAAEMCVSGCMHAWAPPWG